MITARIANEISEVPILGEEPLLRNLQSKIVQAAVEGLNKTEWFGKLEQRTIDFIQDLGYTVVESEKDGDYKYNITWA